MSDDFDQDGVWNPSDGCPETPLGRRVGPDGCEIFYLSSENFKLYKTEKCPGKNSITIKFETFYLFIILILPAQSTKQQTYQGSTWKSKRLIGWYL